MNVVDADDTPVPWLAMEYMDGGTLASVISASGSAEPPSSAASEASGREGEEARSHTLNILSTVSYTTAVLAHAGVGRCHE